jgi:hypothetical protein
MKLALQLTKAGQGRRFRAVEATPYPAVSPLMTTRRFRPPWHADKIAGGYAVRDANGAKRWPTSTPGRPRGCRAPRKSALGTKGIGSNVAARSALPTSSAVAAPPSA